MRCLYIEATALTVAAPSPTSRAAAEGVCRSGERVRERERERAEAERLDRSRVITTRPRELINQASAIIQATVPAKRDLALKRTSLFDFSHKYYLCARLLRFCSIYIIWTEASGRFESKVREVSRCFNF